MSVRTIHTSNPVSKELAMCYLVRQQQPEGAPPPGPQSSGSPGLRPRWIGAAALTLVGGAALAAALVSLPPAWQPQESAIESGAPAPVATRPTEVPMGGGVEQTSLQIDDGVPTSTKDVAKSGAGYCNQGL
jgi:hypothetical protein